jgi:phosphotransferase system HPr (HPr) family protein
MCIVYKVINNNIKKIERWYFMEYQGKVKITWSNGLHIRPVTMIVKKLQKYSCDVKFTKENLTCNAKSLMQILTLGAQQGDELIVSTKGEDAKEAWKEMQDFFQTYKEEGLPLW